MSSSTQSSSSSWPHRGLQVVRTDAPKPAKAKPRIFLLEGHPHLLDYIHRGLSRHFDLHCFEESKSFLKALQTNSHVDMVVYAWETASQSLYALQELRKIHPSVPLLLLCCSADTEEYSVLAGLGAASIMQKPFTAEDLHNEIREHLTLGSTDIEARESVLDSTHSFVRVSKAMHEVERQASLVAKSEIPVLILGESGTGKEILAIFVHKMSKRRDRTFMKINCAAMPAELLESELFGYEQGAFTGAVKTKPGKFETCDGGTIFLDEIGEMPAQLQAKLLQVLQDGTFSRLGSRSTMKTDVRVISATNVIMKQAIMDGSFREDLYYRLNGLSIKLPPLRERLDELPTLVKHFMDKGAARFGLEPLPLSLSLQNAMLQYRWPGNLRELENLVNRLLVLRDEQAILPELQAAPLTANTGQSSSTTSPASSIHVNASSPRTPRNAGEPDATTIARVLEEKLWNRRAAADALNISYKSLLYKIKQYDLTRRSA